MGFDEMDDFSANALEPVESRDRAPKGADIANIAMPVFRQLTRIGAFFNDVVSRVRHGRTRSGNADPRNSPAFAGPAQRSPGHVFGRGTCCAAWDGLARWHSRWGTQARKY